MKKLDGVREYAEGYVVTVKTVEEYLPEELHKLIETNEWDGKRLVVVATNEGGYNDTAIDLVDLLEWVNLHMPELLDL